MNAFKGTVRATLRASVVDGVFWSIMMGFVEGFIVPFALLLQAGGVEIGLLRSAPALIASLIQIRAADAVAAFGGRKAFMTSCVLVQSLSLGLMSLTAYLSPPGALRVLLLLTVLYTASGTLAGPPWTSLMGDYLPASKRGAFLGWRNRLLGFTLTGFSLLGGAVLSSVTDGSGRGFALLFAVGAGARFASWLQLRAFHERTRRVPHDEAFSFFRFISKTPTSNFARFTVSCSLLMFGTYLSSPFFAPHMIDHLGFGYAVYTAVISAGMLALYASMSRWGLWADYIGGIGVVRLGLVMMPAIPLLWCFSADPRLLAVFELFSGFAWAAYGMGTSTFLYDAVSPGKRTRCAAYFAASIGLAQFLGGTAGGWLYENLPPVGGSSFYPLLVLSATSRLAAAAVFFLTVREVRPVPSVGKRHLILSLIGFRPLFYR